MAQTITATTTPVPSAELVHQFSEVVSIWNTLLPIMAVLLVVLVALGIVGLMIWIGRNNSSTAISVLSQANTSKDKEVADLKAQREQEHSQHIEAMDKLDSQFQRTNDLSAETNKILIAVNDRGLERDTVQKQLAEDVHLIVNGGSKPVQEILSRVQTIAEDVARIDSRTADWPALLDILTPLLIELGALRVEAKKHSTQPIAVINIPPVETSLP